MKVCVSIIFSGIIETTRQYYEFQKEYSKTKIDLEKMMQDSFQTLYKHVNIEI